MAQPPDCDPLYKDLPNGNCGFPFVSIIYFVSFIIINFMIVINMYIAIILENFNQAHQEEEIGIVEEDLEMFYGKWSKYEILCTINLFTLLLTQQFSGLTPMQHNLSRSTKCQTLSEVLTLHLGFQNQTPLPLSVLTFRLQKATRYIVLMCSTALQNIPWALLKMNQRILQNLPSKWTKNLRSSFQQEKN